MKAIRSQLLMLLLAVMFGCHDESLEKKESVQFSIDLAFTDDSGGRISDASEVPAGASLRVSIATQGGTSVLNMEEIELLRVGGSLTTAPIQLSTGSYKLTDFMIVSDDGEVLFATPRRGSPLAAYVSNPLDVPFGVGSGNINNLAMAVMDVSTATPEDFGYVGFGINVVHPMKVAVFGATPQGPHPIPAKITFEHGEPVLQTIYLSAGVNKFGFKFDTDETYVMRISREGYKAYEREFTYSSLMDELDGGTLVVTLEPGMTVLTPYYTVPDNYLVMDIRGSAPIGLTVNWGDGTIEEIELKDLFYIQHDYVEVGRYAIHITGDLDKVELFGGSYSNVDMDEVDLTLMPNLKTLAMGLCRLPKTINLSNNKKLNSLSLAFTRGVEKIVLPSGAPLNNVYLRGSIMKPNVVSNLIGQVYDNAMESFVYDGEFTFSFSEYPGPQEGDPVMFVGPPSAAALEQLRTLRSQRGWTIEPAEF